MKNKELNNINHIFIIGPMELNSLSKLDKIITRKTLILYIDGGLRHFDIISTIFSNNQFLLMGDNDSAVVDPEKFSHLLPPMKDYTDLGYALSFIKKNCSTSTKLDFDGFDGGRLDHQLLSLMNIANLGYPSVFWPQKGKFIISPAKTYDYKIVGTFSVILFSQTELEITGDCHYKLSLQSIRPFSDQLISNIGHGDVTIKHNKTIGIYLDENK